ncbi:MarR family winged helix-turn-helix transcriptional regulator [Limosilactobacillus difficilis]|uniref:MarR family winged helix-turn-helix transcriptional regulator n=1 Tax=Limosilactobacillus difficilis TaxID=2991838 RepID=UPI0024BB7A9F|nr:MarR family transcriptional regulator [Limosilactobacillus difficilis]
MMLDKQQIAEIRDFNRQYTRALGVFNRKIFGTDLSWADARIIVEIGINHLNSPSLLARKLNIDKSYVSRIINKLVKKGFLTKTASVQDSRAVELHFTAAGQQLFKQINERSNDLIDEIIKGLTDQEQREFWHSVQTANRLLFKK